jgi:hypothetical protein
MERHRTAWARTLAGIEMRRFSVRSGMIVKPTKDDAMQGGHVMDANEV